MDLRVGDVADATGVGVDTVRFYQARGLIPAPRRQGRFAIYDDRHVERIRRIRSLLDAGFRLAQIRELLDLDRATEPEPDGRGDPPRDRATARERSERIGTGADPRSLLDALAARTVGTGLLTQIELAAEAGVPEPLIAAAVQAGLVQPVEIHGEERFPRSDLEMLRVALEILGLGLPLDRLLELASEHAAHMNTLAERAIDVFDDHVRKPRGDDEEAIRQVFERLLPRATQVVALHFQRTIVARALERLRAHGDERALESALEATRARHLEVAWR